ncbi:hypothetical protein ABEB36_007127 [Hypothenemus hampei]|uniref:Uncharacterized protein n=1 Tax=Hypothenemus hampei TaxID=57062 RepID=A0ABD1ESX9_HYPHA
MISTKDNLWVRPWQQRKYQHHKNKVLKARPVVDTRSPPERPHVTTKLKKLQKEYERSKAIERDNFILLQKLNYIMSTHWLDNYLGPQPKFLNRMPLYRTNIESGIDLDLDDFLQETKEELNEIHIVKPRCLACSSAYRINENEKKKTRSRSVPPKTTTKLAKEIKPKSADTKKFDLAHMHRNIRISRGSLKLSVNFPLNSTIELDSKDITGRKPCECARKTAIQ